MDSTAARTEPAQAPASARNHASMHFLMLLATVCWAANIVAGKKALLGFGPLALAQLRSDFGRSGYAIIAGGLVLGLRRAGEREQGDSCQCRDPGFVSYSHNHFPFILFLFSVICFSEFFFCS